MNPEPQRFTEAFFRRDPVSVARSLLGQRLVRRDPRGERLAGLIVEVEAYLGVEDAAAHTFGGRRTERVASMWGPGGRAYVYFTYGMHHCLNVVTQNERHPSAVLLRALEPTEGLAAMRSARPAAWRDTDLCSGPARLTQAMGIDRSLDGEDLIASERLWLERVRRRRISEAAVVTGPRVGVAYTGRLPGDWGRRHLRFAVRANPHVSPAPWPTKAHRVGRSNGK